jgi:hypothetical protein
MAILCPPVVPYWLALGVALFGEHVELLKLWLFPFVLTLAWSLNALLRRFAPGSRRVVLPVLMLSPAVLPTVNLMLDVPAVALALVAVELFARAADRRRVWLAAFAGAAAGVAMQTKYTALVAPVVIVWYALTHGQWRLGVLACGVSAAVFAGWELLLVQKYGESHFARHAGSAGSGGFREFVEGKFDQLGPLAGYLGCLAVGPGLLALASLRVPRKWLAGIGVAWSVGFALVATLPRRWTLFGDFPAASAYWQLSGLLWFAAVACAALVLVARVRKGGPARPSADAVFLAGWFALEAVFVLGLTPFAAARRVIGLSLVMGLVTARLAGRVGRTNLERRAPRWVAAVGIGAGVLVAAIETLDAFPEKLCAEAAAARLGAVRPEATVWYVGHWGFQYYCERSGMRPLIAGQTAARAGDYLVVPSTAGRPVPAAVRRVRRLAPAGVGGRGPRRVRGR